MAKKVSKKKQKEEKNDTRKNYEPAHLDMVIGASQRSRAALGLLVGPRCALLALKLSQHSSTLSVREMIYDHYALRRWDGGGTVKVEQ